MKLPRFSIKTLMGLVLIVALDFAMFRLLGPGRGPSVAEFFDLVIVGILPMANIVAIALLLRLEQRSSHPALQASLQRFEVSGWMVLLCATIIFLIFTRPMHDWAGGVAESIVHPTTSQGARLCFLLVLIALFLLPSLALALAGARFLARYRISLRIERQAPVCEDRTATTKTSNADRLPREGQTAPAP
jgi:hypothetical protein